MHEVADCVVIGAGVVGLAVARALALRGREVIVLEAEDAFGTHTSSRNSEVIHAGIYYPNGSLKARLCVEGKAMLYAYCEARGIAHARLGKLIVATSDDEAPELAKYRRLAEGNGVLDLADVDAAQARELEPEVRCVTGLWSPSTGIVDSHALMLTLLGDAENRGALLSCASPVLGGRLEDDGILLEIGGAEPMTLLARTVVNSAGLHAPAVAASLAGFPARCVPPTYYAKAHYFTLSGRQPFRHLVYPVAHGTWLGVHVTVDLGGQARFGPDIEWVDGIDYTFDDTRIDQFYPAIRRYYPELRDGALQAGYTGIRPKISGPRDTPADFSIQTEAEHGIPDLLHLFGIESPGLTSSLAIAERVADALEAPAADGAGRNRSARASPPPPGA
jgi:L-2-hydroxyglutarate oxidase LhgO